MDYGTANDSGSNLVSLPAGTTCVRYYTPSEMWLGYIDAIVAANHPFSCTNNAGDPLTVVRITAPGGQVTNFYRIYGSCPNYVLSAVRFNFTVSAETIIEFKTLRVCSLYGATHFSLVAKLNLQYGGQSQTDVMPDIRKAVTLSFDSLTEEGSAIPDPFYGYIYLVGWQKFDFVDVFFSISGADTTGIAAFIKDIALPMELYYVDSSGSVVYPSSEYSTFEGVEHSSDNTSDVEFNGIISSSESYYVHSESKMIVARVDLRGLDRSMNFTPVIAFRGYRGTGAISVSVTDYSGYICAELPNGDLIWYQKIYKSVVDGFSDLKSFLASRFTAITERLDVLINGNGEESELIEGAADISDQVSDIGSYEQSQQEILDQALPEITEAVSVSSFSASLAFVQRYLNLGWLALGDFTIIYTLPIFIGFFFFICGRLPGATRALYRPPKQKGGSL